MVHDVAAVAIIYPSLPYLCVYRGLIRGNAESQRD